MEEVYIWMDGTYHLAADGEPPTYMSDDYFIVEIPDDIECVDEFVSVYIAEVNLGSSTDTRTNLN
jgi:hypothetical protein